MAPRKRKSPKKIVPPKEVKETIIETAPFHLIFPFTLIHKEGTALKYCYFQVKEHLDKYVHRHQLKSKDFKVEITKPREKL